MSVKHPTPKRPRPSIRLDKIHPADFMKYDFRHSCEHCSHFSTDNGICTLGYPNKFHRLEANLKQYEITGQMALCRFLEID